MTNSTVGSQAKLQPFLDHLHRGGNYANWWTKALAGNQSTWWNVGSPKPVPSQGDVYFSVHPSVTIPTTNDKGKLVPSTEVRSRIATIAAINCLFAEYDSKDYGSKGAALSHIENLAPAPSVIIDSGNGYHCYWLLSEPFMLATEGDRLEAERLEAAWVALMGGDTKAKDLARILRVPGTFNRKQNPALPVEFVKYQLEQTYPLGELASYAQPPERPPEASQEPPQALEPMNVPSSTDDKRKAAYGQAALAKELDLLRGTGPGSRNDQLNRSAFSLGQLVADYGLNTNEVENSLYHVACSIGLDKAAEGGPAGISATIKSGMTAGGLKLRPALVDTRGTYTTTPTTPMDSTAAPRAAMKAPEPSCRALPVYAQLDPALAATASPWLDAYIAYSREWSPLGYDAFHEACGLWLLSTIAARRVAAPVSGMKYSSLYIALTARTSVWAKSTTADLALDLLRRVGADYLLAPEECTPQSLIQQMAGKVPPRYGELDEARQGRARQSLGFAGQRGWWYDEFGQKLSGMMREGGSMQDFRGLLRKLDASPDSYLSTTIGRGADEIDRPYLSLLASLTPSDLAPYAQQGSALWGDGFFARFAFVAPPADAKPRLQAAFPQGERIPPAELVMALAQWHKRLGMPDVALTERTRGGKGTGEYTAEITPAPVQACTLAPEARSAYEAYFRAMRDLVINGDRGEDLDGSYTRFPEKALRVAMLLGSLENNGHITLSHWARGQQIAEQWRANLHNLQDQLASQGAMSKAAVLEDKVMAKVLHLGGATATDIRRYVHIGTDEATKVLDALVAAGSLAYTATQRGARKYFVPDLGETTVALSSTVASSKQQNIATELPPLDGKTDEEQNSVAINSDLLPCYSATLATELPPLASTEAAPAPVAAEASQDVAQVRDELATECEARIEKLLKQYSFTAAREEANQYIDIDERRLAALARIDAAYQAHKAARYAQTVTA